MAEIANTLAAQDIEPRHLARRFQMKTKN